MATQQYHGITELLQLGKSLEHQWHALGLAAPLPSEDLLRQAGQLLPDIPSPLFSLTKLDAWLSRQKNSYLQQQTQLAQKQNYLKLATRQLAGQHKTNICTLREAQKAYTGSLRVLDDLTVQQNNLVKQASRLSQLVARMPGNHIYKDKLKQALKQADKLKQALLRSQHALESQQEKCDLLKKRVAQLKDAEKHTFQQVKQKGMALAQARQKLLDKELNLRLAGDRLSPANKLKQELESSVEQCRSIAGAWLIKKDDTTAYQHMRQAVMQAENLARQISRWERLLLALDIRLPRRISLLQTWHQESKDLGKQTDGLEAELQELLGQINAENYQQHIDGELGFKLGNTREKLNSLLKKAHLLERQSSFLSKAVPHELERGRRWTEQWRLAAKEQRSLLTQASAWQQEARENAAHALQRLDQLRPGWNEQAMLLANWLDVWPDIIRRLSELDQYAHQLQLRLNTLDKAAIPAPKVSNLVKTPVSFKQYSAAWRRLLPEHSQVETLSGMLQTVDYWINILSKEFSRSLVQPLQHDNEQLTRQLTEAQQINNRLQQARQRSARHIWEIRKSKIYQQVHIGELSKIIDEISLDISQARSENSQLHDLLQQSKQEQILNQARINSLLESNQAGEQARHDLQRLEGVLVHVRQEKAEQRLRLETTIKENTLLAAQKDNLYQQLLQARQEKQNLAHNVKASHTEHALALAQINDLRIKEANGEHAREEVQRLKGIIRNFRRQQKQDHLQIEEIQLENAQLHGYKIKSENLAHILKQILDRHKQAQVHIDDLLEKNSKLTRGQALNLHLQAEIFQLRTREEHYKLRIEQLEAIGLNVAQLETSLQQARRLAQALKGKMLERHRLYRQSQKALAQLTRQQTRNVELEVSLAQLQEQFTLNEQARDKLRAEYQQAVRDRDMARAALIQERSVRTALLQQEQEQQTLQQQLELARDEARHWQQMARELQQAMQRTDSQDKTSWQRVAARSVAKSSELEEKINRLLLQVEREAPQPKQAFISHRQTERVLSNLQQARRKLKSVGKNILHGWALVAVLSGSLLLGTPTVSGTAVLPASSAEQDQLPDIRLSPRAVVSHNSIAMNLDLRPSRSQRAPLPLWMEQLAGQLAKQYNLPLETIKVNALTLWETCDDLSAENVRLQMQNMAGQGLALLNSSPHISRSLERQPVSEKNDLQMLFYAKLFDEYCSLGHTPAQALGAISSNLWASQQLNPNSNAFEYKGQVQPLAEIETLDCREFVQRISPYIESRMKRFMASHAKPYKGESASYARNLALDIYQAAETFAVPKTLMLAIAHQETFFANVLGDSNRSASPFQIFAPTRRLVISELARSGFVAPPSDIRLERHLTMATFMAAFHLKQLIDKSSQNGHVYTDRLLRSYNGASVYIGLVGKRQQQLAGYLAKPSN